MASLYNSDLKPLAPGVPTHPYDHATKLFLADNYRLAPKQSFLYYVVINIDPSVYASNGILGTVVGLADRYKSLETGMLVKRIELPKFSMTTKTLNAYNKKTIIQNNITYEAINITFHDDTADVITNFWNDYYTYYFRDSDYSVDTYSTLNLNRYNLRRQSGWGFSPRNGSIAPFLNNIRIFSLHNKRFTEYYIVNPIIRSWKHGEHESSDGNGIMSASMTVEYETVKYFTGYVNPVNVDGFALLHYDNYNSPISNSVTNIYSDAGLLGAIEGTAKDLAQPDGSGGAGGPLSSLLSLYRAYNNLKNVNLKNVVGTSLAQIGAGIINRTLNNAINYAFPIFSPRNSSQLLGSSFITPSVGTNGVTVNGVASTIVAGPAVSLLNTLNLATSQITRGIQTTARAFTSPITNPIVADVVKPNTGISVSASSLQPPTGTTTALILNDSGETVSEFRTTSTSGGAYDPANKDINLKSIQTTTDESNNEVEVRTYLDGTQVTLDSQGNQLGIALGTRQSQTINVNPANTRDLAARGVNVDTTTTQYYTNPTTGLVYTVGGTTAARITNTLSGSAGAAAGLAAGINISQALDKTFLGKTIAGRTISAAIGTVTGATVGRAVNNGLQTILNPTTGAIAQGWDSISNEIKNVVGTWTGSGGYNPSRPNDNRIVATPGEDGSITSTYKDGTVVTTRDGVDTVIPGTNSRGLQYPPPQPGAPVVEAFPIPNNPPVDESGFVVYDNLGELGINTSLSTDLDTELYGSYTPPDEFL